jgi:hypothetical protein
MHDLTCFFSISFVSTISHDGESTDSLRLTVPVIIGQRYGDAPYQNMNANKRNTFALNVSVQMNAPVTSISSPTHPISMILGRHANETTDQLNPLKAHISLHSETFLEKDVVLIIAAQKLDHPRCNVERWLEKDGAEETTDAYALTFVPKVDLPPVQAQGKLVESSFRIFTLILSKNTSFWWTEAEAWREVASSL